MKRTYVGELEFALNSIRSSFHDRNPNRQAMVDAALAYANAVSIARRSRLPLPPRPKCDRTGRIEAF